MAHVMNKESKFILPFILIVHLLLYLFASYLDLGTGFNDYSIACISIIFTLALIWAAWLITKCAIETPLHEYRKFNFKNTPTIKIVKGIFVVGGCVIFFGYTAYVQCFQAPYRVIEGKHIHHAWSFGILFFAFFVFFIYIILLMVACKIYVKYRDRCIKGKP